MRWRVRLGLVLGGLVLAIVLFHRMAGEYPASAVVGASFEVAIVAIARLIGLTVAYWLLGSALLLMLARISALPAAIRTASWLTWWPLRKLVERGLASGLVLALAGPAAASASPGYVPTPAGDPSTTSTFPPASTTTTTLVLPVAEVDTSESVYLPIEDPRQAAVVTTLGAVEVTVKPGDNMWLFAERRLRELKGDQITDADTAPYWLAVIAANRNRIRSGDPDLIFPGEVLLLPEWG
jgi:hypothetical protein